MARLWPYAEVRRGLSVREDFPSADRLSNDWTLIGSPGVDDGLILDGTNYARRNLVGSEFNSSEISIALKFVPLFEADDNTLRYIFDTTDGTNRYAVQKTGLSDGYVLRVFMGNVTIANIPFVTYGQHWVPGAENTLSVHSASSNTDVYLNGVKILDANGTSWTQKSVFSFYAGASFAGTARFLGTIKEVKVFKQKLTQQEAIDYHNNETYCWRSKAVVDLPMLQAQHDPSNTTGVELVANGDFSDGLTDWTVSESPPNSSVTASGGSCRVLSTDGTLAIVYQTILESGKTYFLKFDILSITGQLSFAANTNKETWDSAGAKSIVFVADGTNAQFKRNGICDAVISNISIEETDARTLDVSGDGSHGTLGDGSTASTIPDKSETRGYRFDGVDDAVTGLPALSGDYTVVFAEPNNVSVVNNDTLYNQIQTPGGFAGHLLELVAVPELLTPTQVFDAIYHARTQARMI